MDCTPPLLTACLIVRNEAEHLPRCLRSVAPLVDHMVVVDTGSTDDTVQIARAAGARVESFPWRDDFSAARNHALGLAQTPWILVIDADEEVSPCSAPSIREKLSTSQAAAHRLTIRNFTPDEEFAAWHDHRLIRLVRNDERYRFEGAVHEQLATSVQRNGGVIDDIDLLLLHHGYRGQNAQGRDRATRNVGLLQKVLQTTPDDLHSRFELGCALLAAGRAADAESTFETVRRSEASLPRQTRAAVHAKMAQLALARGDDQVASRRAQRALSHVDDDIVALQVLLVADLSLGRRQTGIAVADRLRQDPRVRPAARSMIETLISSLGS